MEKFATPPKIGAFYFLEQRWQKAHLTELLESRKLQSNGYIDFGYHIWLVRFAVALNSTRAISQPLKNAPCLMEQKTRWFLALSFNGCTRRRRAQTFDLGTTLTFRPARYST